MIGPGKYDDLATLARFRADARGVILIVIEGNHGSGFSVQAPAATTLALPAMLRLMANEIERDNQELRNDNRNTKS